MDKLVNLLSGKKSYIVAGLMILAGLLQGDLDLVLEGLAVAGLRAGIAKS